MKLAGVQIGKLRISMEDRRARLGFGLSQTLLQQRRRPGISRQRRREGRPCGPGQSPFLPHRRPNPLPSPEEAAANAPRRRHRVEQFHGDVQVAHLTGGGGDARRACAPDCHAFFSEERTSHTEQQTKPAQGHAQFVDRLRRAVPPSVADQAGQTLHNRSQPATPATVERRRSHADYRFGAAGGRITVWLCSRRNCWM